MNSKMLEIDVCEVRGKCPSLQCWRQIMINVKEFPVNANYDVEQPSKQNTLYSGLDVVLSTMKHFSIRPHLLC